MVDTTTQGTRIPTGPTWTTRFCGFYHYCLKQKINVSSAGRDHNQCPTMGVTRCVPTFLILFTLEVDLWSNSPINSVLAAIWGSLEVRKLEPLSWHQTGRCTSDAPRALQPLTGTRFMEPWAQMSVDTGSSPLVSSPDLLLLSLLLSLFANMNKTGLYQQ